MADTSHAQLVEKVVVIIESSHLSVEDKKLLNQRVPYVADIILQMFLQVCDEDPFGIDMLVKNLKKKLDAQGNLAKIHEIVKQERREVEDLIVSGRS